MITVLQAVKAVEDDLLRRGEKYLSIAAPEEVSYQENWLIAKPMTKDLRAIVFLVRYKIPWVLEYEEITAQVSAETGEVLARLGPANYSG